MLSQGRVYIICHLHHVTLLVPPEYLQQLAFFFSFFFPPLSLSLLFSSRNIKPNIGPPLGRGEPVWPSGEASGW